MTRALITDKSFRILLLFILVVALAFRLYKYDSPIADWHSWRQADTSSVTRTFIQEGLDVFHPKYDDISNIASGKDNPQGWRMVEFPIYNIWQFIIYWAFNFLNVEESGRVATAIVSVLGIGVWALIIRRMSGPILGILTAIVWTCLPYAIFYNRVILPDPMMVTLCICSTYTLLRAMENGKMWHLWWYSSAIIASLAVLTKPTAVFYLVAQGGIIFLPTFNWRPKRKWLWLISYVLIVATPLLWWREIWIRRFESGIASSQWLLNGDGIRGRPAWIRWIFYERIGLMMLGAWNVFLFTLGICTKKEKREWWFILLGLMMFVYLLVFATGNVRHDYYQIPLIPFVSWAVAAGFYSLWTSRKNLIPGSILLGLLVWFIGTILAWYQIKSLYQINNPLIIKTGIRAQEVLPASARVIAPYNGDTAFLYQINRKGWPMTTDYPIERMIAKGATHYVSVNYNEETKDLMSKFFVIEATPEYVIIDLTQKLRGDL